MITLICHAVDKDLYPLGDIFVVTIPLDNYVAQIKLAVFSFGGTARPQFDGVRVPDELTLYKLSEPCPVRDEDDSSTVGMLLDAILNREVSIEPLVGIQSVSKYFDPSLPKQRLHLLVQAPTQHLDGTNSLSPLTVICLLLNIRRHLKSGSVLYAM